MNAVSKLSGWRLKLTGVGIISVGLISCGGGGSSTGTNNISLELREIAGGFTQPMMYAANPANAALAYVPERGGRIFVLQNGIKLPTPLLDLSGSLTTGGECGLLGMTFDPAFASNRQIYVHYASTSPVQTRVVRYTLDAAMTSATVSSARNIITINQPTTLNHKGGSIEFGADGTLYMATGDGGGSDDPTNLAQSPTSLLGKILRIDVNGDSFPTDNDNNYSIPTNNPFMLTAGVRGEIWAFGMRNPFRWTFDRTLNGLILADVGQGLREEINFVSANSGGRNFGWRVREGKTTNGNAGPLYGITPTDPFLDYDHGLGLSITGGVIYRGPTLNVLRNRYVFADFITNRLWSVAIQPDGTGGAQPATMAGNATEHFVPNGFSGVVSIDRDANGELVITEFSRGRVARLASQVIP